MDLVNGLKINPKSTDYIVYEVASSEWRMPCWVTYQLLDSKPITCRVHFNPSLGLKSRQITLTIVYPSTTSDSINSQGNRNGVTTQIHRSTFNWETRLIQIHLWSSSSQQSVETNMRGISKNERFTSISSWTHFFLYMGHWTFDFSSVIYFAFDFIRSYPSQHHIRQFKSCWPDL